MHYYQFNIGDYAKHTQHLSLLEHLAYRLLLDRYYLTEKPLELNTKKLARLIGMSQHQEEVEQVLEDFFYKTENGYSNNRCEAEIASFHSKAETARENGKKGGRPRKNNDIQNQKQTGLEPKKTQPVNLANPEETGSKANHKPRTINQEPLTSGKDNMSNDKSIDVFNFWIATMDKNHNSTKLTSKRLKAIKARFREGYTLEDIKTAIVNCSKSQWHMGQNPNNTMYNDIELICRNGEKLEQFRDSLNVQQQTPQYSDVTAHNIAVFKDVELK